MPTILAHCPKCQTKYKLKDSSLLGKKLKCKKCSTSFRIKDPSRKQPDAVDEFDEFDDFTDDLSQESGSPNSDDPYARPMALPAGGRKLKKKIKNTGSTQQTKKKATAEEEEKSKAVPIIIGVVGSILAIGMIVVVVFVGPSIVDRAKQGAAVEIPENYEVFNADDSALKFEFPEGWEVRHGGGTSGRPIFARIEHDGILIEIDENLGASAVGEVSQIFGGGDDHDIAEIKPVHQAHMQQREVLMIMYDEYNETSPEVIETGMGEGRLSSYINPGTFSTEKGYRATLMRGRHTYFIFCRSNPDQFESLKPTLRYILESISPGKRP